MTEIFTGLKALWNADATLKAALPRLYSTQAPPRATMPYGVMSLVGSIPDYSFDYAYDHPFIQFACYADDTAEIQDIHDKLIDVYEHAIIAGDDSKNYKTIRRLDMIRPDETGEAFQCIVEYEIMKAI